MKNKTTMSEENMFEVNTLLAFVCFEFFKIKRLLVPVEVYFPLCPMTKALEKRHGFLFAMVFGLPIMTMKNHKSFFLTALGHMCKTTMFFEANPNVKSTTNTNSQDAY